VLRVEQGQKSEMRLRRIASLVLLGSSCLPLACGGGGEGAPPPARPIAAVKASAAPPPPPAPAPSPRPVVGVDERAMDSAASPCEDFYKYACGGWLKETPIPDDQPEWTRSFDVIHERNEALLRQVLEHDAAAPGSEAYARQLGDFYVSCMDEKAIEASTDKAVQTALAQVDAVSDASSLATVLAGLHAVGVGALFTFDSGQDFKDATQVIALAAQGGLGLPDRDYYLKNEPKQKEIRDKYEAHVAAMFGLAGAAPDVAKANAKVVLRLEAELARVSMTKVDLRDPKKIYHRVDLAGLKKIAPDFAWDAYLKGAGFPDVTAVNVLQPKFFEAVGAAAKSLKNPAAVGDWKTYLKWHVLRGSAPALGQKFVDENFRFKSALTGAPKILPRWKRCVRAVDEGMGEALAQPFVKATLGAEGKETARSMVAAIEARMKSNLESLPWMDAMTRKKSLEKLAKIDNKIGYPDAWRSYDGLALDRVSYLENVRRANAFETKRRLAKIGKPLDRREWEMTPPTVNAYYEAPLNEMVFPAGILQPPFYSNDATTGVNFGGIGMVMGHELTHGFDDEGRQFDGDGNLKDWWTPKVGKDFDRRAACVASQFDGYVAVDDLHVNGKLTLGENIADLGGLRLAYYALEAALTADAEKAGRAATAGDGKFTPEQQFFLGYAQAWCSNVRDEMTRLWVHTDPHSPAKFRVIGPLSNLTEFAKAFSCKEGSAMVRPANERCEIW